MPLQIQRTATVYRLWVDEDVKALFEDHAAAGWLCTMNCAKDGDQVVWQVSLQNTAARQLATATTHQVVVSDLVSVQPMSLLEYNLAHPENVIEEPGS